MDSAAKQADHLLERYLDVCRHGPARLARLALLDSADDVPVPDPSRHSLRAQRIETSHVTERQTKLIDDALVPRNFGEPQMEGLVGYQDLVYIRAAIVLDGDDTSKLGDAF